MAAQPTQISDRTLSLTQIKNHIPIILDMNQMNYDLWRELFETHCHSFTVLGHLDGISLPTGPTDTAWSQVDGTVKMWIYGTISESLLKSVLKTKCSARELWTTIENLFRDNKEARAIQLKNELRSLTIGDLSVHEYCQKLKTLSDLLANVNSPITECVLVMHLLNGLSSKFDNIVNVIKHRSPPCSFNDARSMLKDEEDRLKTQRRPDPSHVDHASSPQVLLAASPQTYDNRTASSAPQYQNNRNSGRNNRVNRGGGRHNRGRGNSNWNSGNWNQQQPTFWNGHNQLQWPALPPWSMYPQWANMPMWPGSPWSQSNPQVRAAAAPHTLQR